MVRLPPLRPQHIQVTETASTNYAASFALSDIHRPYVHNVITNIGQLKKRMKYHDSGIEEKHAQ